MSSEKNIKVGQQVAVIYYENLKKVEAVGEVEQILVAIKGAGAAWNMVSGYRGPMNQGVTVKVRVGSKVVNASLDRIK